MNLLSQLDSFKNNQKIISYDQSTNDIINAILRQHNRSLNDYDKIYSYFDNGNVYSTAKRIFNYLKENIKYQIESENTQTVGTPSYILATKKGDCKHFSLMFAGLLDAYRRNTGQKFDLAYRFASYDGSKTPEHVFVVINSNSNNEIWCDAVLDYFNEKKQPNYYKDKKIENMALMAMSGINGNSQMNGLFDFATKKTDQGNTIVSDVSKGIADAVPFGNSILSLVNLVSGLIPGHSDSYLLDIAFKNKEWDKALGIFFTWYQQVGFDGQKKPWFKAGTSQGIAPEVPEPFKSMRRIEWLPTIWDATKNTDLAYIINEAISKGLLDKKYFINSKNQMAAEPNAFNNLFGGSTTPGTTTNSGISTPLIIGGVAAVGLIVYFISKKKK